MFRTSQVELPLFPGAAILLACLLLCAVLWRIRARPVLWCLPFALLLTATYALHLHAMRDGTLYGGLRNDQSFIVAYTNNIIAGNWLGDFFDKRVPTHYPPLLFWIVGAIARVFGLTGLEIWRLVPLVVLAALPFVAFAIGRSLGGDRIGFYACTAMLAIGGFHTQFYFGTGDPLALAAYMVLKPYELLGALLMVAWLLAHTRGQARQPPPGPRWVVLQGVVGGIALLLYHPWFAIGTAVLALNGLLLVAPGQRTGYWLRLAAATAISLALSAVFWLRYLLAWIEHGAERNYQLQPLNVYSLDPTAVTVGMGWFGLLFFLACAGFTQRRRWPGLRVLLLAAGVVYAWFLSTFVTHPLLGISFLPVKCHLVLLVIFAFAAAVGIDLVRERTAGARFAWLLEPPALAVLALLLMPNPLRWNSHTDSLIDRGERPIAAHVLEIAHELDRRGAPTIAGDADMHELAALSAMRPYTAPNIHYANPLTRYRARIDALEAAAAARTPEALATALGELGIDGLLLRKGADGERYMQMPYRRGMKDRIDFDPACFAAPQFERAFENDALVLELLWLPSR